MASKDKQRKPPPFSNLQYALLGTSVNVYGVVEDIVASNSDGHLSIHLMDESGRLELDVPPIDADLFRTLEIGDILRCYNLDKFGDKIQFGGNKEYQCVAWLSSAENQEDFTVKFATSNNDVPYNERRIADLRAIKIDKQPEKLETEMEKHKEAIVLAQACGQTRPPMPEKLKKFSSAFKEINIHIGRTLGVLSDIPNHTKQFTVDKFFNIFTQIVGIHSGKDYTVFQVWDGSVSEEFANLSQLRSLGTTVIAPLSLPSPLHDRILNVIVYDDPKWRTILQRIKKNDIVLFTNIHVNKRALGEKVLAMHQGHDDKRFLVIVAPEHEAALRVMKRCEEALEQATNIPLSQETIPTQNDPLNVMNIFSSQNSIPLWNPTTQDLQNTTLQEAQPTQQDNLAAPKELETIQEEDDEITVLEVIETPNEVRSKKRKRLSYLDGTKRPKREINFDQDTSNDSNNLDTERSVSPITPLEEELVQEGGPSNANLSIENIPNNSQQVEDNVNPAEELQKSPEKQSETSKMAVEIKWIKTSAALRDHFRNTKMTDYSHFSLRIEEKLARIKEEMRKTQEAAAQTST